MLTALNTAPRGASRRDARSQDASLHHTWPADRDDLGLRPLTQDEPIDLYEIIGQRYEHGSTIITSNRAVEEWPPLFGDVSWRVLQWTGCCTRPHDMDGDTLRNPAPAKPRRQRPRRRGGPIMMEDQLGRPYAAAATAPIAGRRAVDNRDQLGRPHAIRWPACWQSGGRPDAHVRGGSPPRRGDDERSPFQGEFLKTFLSDPGLPSPAIQSPSAAGSTDEPADVHRAQIRALSPRRIVIPWSCGGSNPRPLQCDFD